jgi:hypothetical protein
MVSSRPIDTGLSLVFLIAFSSVLAQYHGLFGADGITPIRANLMQGVNVPEAEKNLSEVVWMLPSFLWLSPSFGISYEMMGEALCVVGVVVAALSVMFGSSTISFGTLWALYLSLYMAGGTFLSFQWDILLLEVGVAAALHAPLIPDWTSAALGVKRFRHNMSARWLLRAVMFKLMLMAGAVKIQADCPTWLGLTALHVHFQGQCLPHSLSWWAAQLPSVMLKLGVALALVAEGPCTFLLLAPHRPTRFIAAWLQIFLQVLIILTGSYNFFNILTILLALIVALPDNSLSWMERLEDSSVSWLVGWILNIGVVVASALWMFDLQHVDQAQHWTGAWDVVLRDTVNHQVVTRELGRVLPWAFAFVAAMMVWNCLVSGVLEAWDACSRPAESVAPAPVEVILPEANVAAPVETKADDEPGSSVRRRRRKAKGAAAPEKKEEEEPTVPLPKERDDEKAKPEVPLPKEKPSGGAFPSSAFRLIVVLFWSLGVAGVSVAILGASAHTAILGLTRKPLSFPIKQARTFAESMGLRLRNWHVTSQYGLFRRMTGVGPLYEDSVMGLNVPLGARPEIIVEGTRDGSTWRALHFPYKPSSLTQAPRLALPHQPRLDWQMWFAALGPYNSSPWFIAFLDKLLEGSPDVTALLDTSRWPFTAPSADDVPHDDVVLPGPNGTVLLRPIGLRARRVYLDFTRLGAPWQQGLPPPLLEASNATVSHQWWYSMGEPGVPSPVDAVDEDGVPLGGEEYLIPLAAGRGDVAQVLTQIGTPRLPRDAREKLLSTRQSCELDAPSWGVALCHVTRSLRGWGLWTLPGIVSLVVLSLFVHVWRG